MKKLFKLLILFMLFSSCSKKALEPCGTRLDVYGNRIYKKEIPSVHYVDYSISEELYKEVLAAAKDINTAADKTLIVILRTENSVSNELDYVNYIYTPSTWLLEKQVQGNTSQRWTTSDGIIDSDILINTTYYNYKTDVDFKTLIMHELLHALGFMHVDNEDAVMYTYLELGVKKSLTKAEIERIRCVYDNP